MEEEEVWEPDCTLPTLAFPFSLRVTSGNRSTSPWLGVCALSTGVTMSAAQVRASCEKPVHTERLEEPFA